MLAYSSCSANANDFDFLLGTWQGHSKRLNNALDPESGWQQFDSTHTGRRILSGIGIEDDFRTEYWPGFAGQSMQVYDPATKLWHVYWVDNRQHLMSPPVSGRFDNGVGTFVGEDTVAGKRVGVRYIWSSITLDSARWEQAFSIDGGKTWQTNWIMTFNR